jgi:hypothetical protein
MNNDQRTPTVNDRKTDKRSYETPELARLGTVSSLTAGGLSGKQENQGMDSMPEWKT